MNSLKDRQLASTAAEMIVLHYTKFKDRSIVLHTLSREYGRRSFLVTVGRSTPMALFLPLSIVQAEVVESPRSSLWRSHAFSPVHMLSGLRGSMLKNSIAMFISEVLYRVVHEDAYEDGLYDWCVSQILALDALEGDYANFHLRWLLDLASALGFAPSIEDLMHFVDSDLPAVRTLLEGSFAEAMLLPLNGSSRSRISESLLRYFSFHTETDLNIRSLDVLREVLR